MAELSLEKRFAQLESRVAELERQRALAEDRDIALLARIDGFIDDLRRVERVQMRGFDDLKAGQKDLATRLDSVESAIGVIVTTLKDQKQIIETLAGRVDNLAAGQAKILAILTGQKGND